MMAGQGPGWLSALGHAGWSGDVRHLPMVDFQTTSGGTGPR